MGLRYSRGVKEAGWNPSVIFDSYVDNDNLNYFVPLSLFYTPSIARTVHYERLPETIYDFLCYYQ